MPCYQPEIDELNADVDVLFSIQKTYQSIQKRNETQESCLTTLADHVAASAKPGNISLLQEQIDRLNWDLSMKCNEELESLNGEIDKLIRRIDTRQILEYSKCPFHSPLAGR